MSANDDLRMHGVKIAKKGLLVVVYNHEWIGLLSWLNILQHEAVPFLVENFCKDLRFN